MFKKKDLGPGVDLSEANLRRVDLKYSDLSGYILRGANLSYSILRGANLTGADLSGADLSGAVLKYSDLSGSILTGADLSGADLSGAILTNTKGLPPMVCPEKGSYVGYKKAVFWEKGYRRAVIITLEIPSGAKRSSATTNKCRCSEAKVLSIESVDGTKKYDKATSSFDNGFIYEVGKTVRVDDFDDDRWAECAPGIHHFMSRKEAVKYLLL